MLSVLIFILAVLMSFFANIVESQPTIDDDIHEVLRLKQENDMQQVSLDRMERRLRICEQRLGADELLSTTGMDLSPQIRTSTEKNQTVVAKLIKRLNQVSSFPKLMLYFVHGVTKYEDRIYILCSQPSSIRIFEDRNPFRRLSEIRLTQIGKPFDMVYHRRSKCLFVTDSDCNCIWKITIADDYQIQMAIWLNGTTNPHMMSLTSDGHLLVLRDDDSSQPRLGLLEIYDGSDARLIRRVKLLSEFRSPRIAIQAKTGGQFLISHVLNGAWVISRVTSNGQTIVAQTNPRSDSEKIAEPFSLSIDADYNGLFVTDWGNNRVLVFDYDFLDFRQILLTNITDGIQYPWRLHYDTEKKQLLVGQLLNKAYNSGGVVDIYEIN